MVNQLPELEYNIATKLTKYTVKINNMVDWVYFVKLNLNYG